MSLALAFASPSPSRAHGPVHERLAALSRQIAADPGNAEHHIRRSELYRVDRDWPAALADLELAARLDPRRSEVHFFRGRVYSSAHRPQLAVAALELYLELVAEKPDLSDRRSAAHLLLGEAEMELDRPLAAAEHYRRAIDLADKPGPEVFLDRAQALATAGQEHLDAALRCLEQGLERLGPLVTLESRAVELELRRRHFDAAAARLKRLASLSPRPESWLVRRGEVLAQAGRPAEAREAYLAARSAIEELNPRRRSRAVAALEERIVTGLARLNSLPDAGPPSP